MRIENKRNYRGLGVYVGRPSVLGNPYHLGKDGNRKEVCDSFEHLARNTPQILAAIDNLKEDDVLICWCSPLECHADRIIKLWNERHK